MLPADSARRTCRINRSPTRKPRTLASSEGWANAVSNFLSRMQSKHALRRHWKSRQIVNAFTKRTAAIPNNNSRRDWAPTPGKRTTRVDDLITPPEGQARSATAREPMAFIPAALDDAGLTPIEFRMYGHFSRRAGSDGRFWESIENAAKHCDVDPRTARNAIRALEQRNLIRCVEAKPGHTRVYALTPPSDWQPLSKNA